MKKTFVIMLAALTALVSCNKEIIDTPADDNNATPITFQLTASHPEGEGTKAVKSAWEAGDVIYVFFQEFAAPKYLKLSYDGSAWAYTQMNGTTEEALGLSNGQEVNMRAVYLPFGSDLSVDADGGKFVFSELQETYYLTATLSCMVADDTVKGNFEMKVPDGYVQFFVKLPAQVKTHKAYAAVELRERQLTPQGIAAINADGSIAHTPIIHGAPLKAYLYGSGEEEGYLFSGILDADARNAAKDYHFTLHVNINVPMPPVKMDLYYGKTYEGNTLYKDVNVRRALLLPSNLLASWTAMEYKPIDLGFDIDLGGGEKRRIYWASRNLGASSDSPAEDTDAARQATWGDYYAWGATEPHYTDGHAYDAPMNDVDWKSGITGYNWDSCPYATADDGSKFSKYTGDDDSYAESGTADGLTVLERDDDAASVALGGAWRMPTIEEWEALLNNFEWDWDDTKKGQTVTVSGGTAWTDPTIFLPAAGFRGFTNLFNAGSYGDYLSSSLDTNNPSRAPEIGLHSGNAGTSRNPRFYGLSVRPVTE